MLADVLRSWILFALATAGERCAGDLTVLDISEGQVSYGLKMQRLAGVASFRKPGRVVFCRLGDGFPYPLLERCLRRLLTSASPEADRGHP